MQQAVDVWVEEEEEFGDGDNLFILLTDVYENQHKTWKGIWNPGSILKELPVKSKACRIFSAYAIRRVAYTRINIIATRIIRMLSIKYTYRRQGIDVSRYLLGFWSSRGYVDGNVSRAHSSNQMRSS